MSGSSLRKSANAQVQRMQDEIETMIRDTIAPTLAEIVAKAAASAMYGSNQVREYSGTVAGGVRSRPLISVLVAAVIGFVAGRVTAGEK
jgi:ElaB/YqjD/DUF883 family membrane-anchored ribosome-binding protein